MPLKFIRTKAIAVDPLQAAVSTTAFTRDLMSTLNFPPATAAISILLVILETIQSIQTNRAGCDRLARRAAKILCDIDEQMRDRWDNAPALLLRNLKKFEETLNVIHDFMRKLADSKWRDRFLRKSSIEGALSEFSTMLDEAAQSFQLATLIDIHYAVNTLQVASAAQIAEQDACALEASVQDSAPPAYDTKEPEEDIIEIETPAISSAAAATSPIATEPCDQNTPAAPSKLSDQYLSDALSSLALDDDHGFRRYHQSDIMLRGRSRLKEGWWEGGMEVQVQGQNALIKRYEGQKDHAYRQWLRDVKILQNLYHPNLPQMLGISDEKTPTPFILLSNVQTQSPQALVREALRSSSIAACTELMLRFYRDLSDTAMYVQRQLGLDENKVQDFFEASSFRVDSAKTLVVGLPPPREGKWYSARNYGLAHSLFNACLNMLPNHGRVSYAYDKGDEEVTDEMQKKINHLVTLARGLLPSGHEPAVLPPRLLTLVEDNESAAPSLTLRQVRDLSFTLRCHDHTWYERSVPAHKFAVGDLGYIPAGETFTSFVRLRNVLEDHLVALDVSTKAFAEHWCWENMPISREPLESYALPGDVNGWAVAVPPHAQIDVVAIHEAFVTSVNDAWRYLLQHGQSLAAEAGVKPHELILVTRAGTHQDFYIKDFRPKPFGMHGQMLGGDPRFAANPFHHQQMHGFQQPRHFGHHFPPAFGTPTLPSIFYLFTSLDPGHEPYWSSSPVCVAKGAPRPSVGRDFTYKIGWNIGFLNYVQLHAEDFMDQ
ncbi:hypothetical protein BV22DRAFT_1132533 [Leucogyrophana mollusca]|uniref:Uncharacterized protein n=1 Tax=Leucogyrophana mollusca TaxID=85980 RepID=A0ACB8B5S1_9AGAM|nr:hypothetical protein BV22DRAFT_1132533 [Leucogyrophana mollusca]